MSRPPLRSFVFRLVGTTFAEGYPLTVFRTIEMLADGPVPARLHRVHDHPHDANAVAVICVAAGGRIGWVPRGVAARIAPAIDAGHRYDAEILEHVEHPQHPENPGLNIRCVLKETAECNS